MAIPNYPGISFPVDQSAGAAYNFILANIDATVTNPDNALVYCLMAAPQTYIENLPLLWNYIGPFVAGSRILNQFRSQGLRLSLGFNQVLIPNLVTSLVKSGLNATSAQVSMQNLVTAFVASPLP